MRQRQANDLLYAYVTLIVAAPHLSPSARRVGGMLLEHLNRKSGRCDPSIERLARLLGVSQTTVKDATMELCSGDDALFERITHGGHNHRTAYIPRWETFADLHAEYRARFKDGSAPPTSRKSGCLTSSKSPQTTSRKTGSLPAENPALKQPENRLQTYRTNLKNKPIPVDGSNEGEEIIPVSALPERSNGLMRKRHPAYSSMPPQVASGRGAAKADAAAAAAERRRAAAIAKLPKHEREAAWLAAMDEKP